MQCSYTDKGSQTALITCLSVSLYACLWAFALMPDAGRVAPIRACVLWKCLVVAFSDSVWNLNWCLSLLAHLRFTWQQYNETIKRVQCFSVSAQCLLQAGRIMHVCAMAPSIPCCQVCIPNMPSLSNQAKLPHNRCRLLTPESRWCRQKRHRCQCQDWICPKI